MIWYEYNLYIYMYGYCYIAYQQLSDQDANPFMAVISVKSNFEGLLNHCCHMPSYVNLVGCSPCTWYLLQYVFDLCFFLFVERDGSYIGWFSLCTLYHLWSPGLLLIPKDVRCRKALRQCSSSGWTWWLMVRQPLPWASTHLIWTLWARHAAGDDLVCWRKTYGNP
jgi:hypothetical protein